MAATANKAQADSIQTWAISEVDGKGKKKKGTLGVGNGAMFFASESDKNPVRKWQTVDIQSVKLEKSKHVHIDVGGPEPANLHFHAGGKDTAEAIMSKLESSRSIAGGADRSSAAPASPPRASPPAEEPIERPRSSAQKSVHFAPDEPEEIPYEEEPEPEEEEEVHDDADAHYEAPDEGESAVVLYDFSADGEDELTVHEGETLWIVEKDSAEWWKCRNAAGEEGVVPASYVEVRPVVVPPNSVTYRRKPAGRRRCCCCRSYASIDSVVSSGRTSSCSRSGCTGCQGSRRAGGSCAA